MARALEFDYDNALERATRSFWESGYASTSLRDLLAAMGIGESSFYNTLKSKKQAYLECLKHYNATIGNKRGAAFRGEATATLGVRALFRLVLDCLDDPSTPSRVCLMAASLTHEVMAEPELRAYVQDQMAALTAQLSARVAEDQVAGLVSHHLDPQIVAVVIITYLQGLWRMALVSYDRSRFEQQNAIFLAGLGL